ncbi:tetratricopeptide repeat protein [Affinibrenneria salicis]|uniref:Ancillary SecYEG translocon subunit n=1 Tax=Affinibrenneria salicis TaxID=2590031 RepID=A0A5J5FSH0_9GAMM|nr:YfgM family protein [Affinibrenneria salicis]KAA8995733.1 tetratricopeptide repeat protein [Affinibrenneria salicis]
MEVYTTENEQVDALRRFLAENGKALVVGVVLGIGALVGWRYWQSHQTNSMMTSSSAFEQTSSSLASGKPEGVSAAERFAVENKNNYGVLTALELAHYYVEQNDLAKAGAQLQQAQAQTKDANLLALINLRLARLQLQEKNADAALKTLETVTLPGWSAMASEVRGDALLSKGDNKAAREAYTAGLDANPPQALQAMLRLKLNNLSS